MSTRCPDCFHRLKIDEDQDFDNVLMNHQMSGACPATDRIIPARNKTRKPRRSKAPKVEVAYWVSPDEFDL